MTGIISYGAYIPIHRLSKADIASSWGVRGIQGEKAVASYDEDSITMAVAAARDCITGISPRDIKGLYFASTSPPYKEKQSAAFIATVLGLERDAFTADFSGSLRSGTNALRTAFDAVNSGSAETILVCASDLRLGHPKGTHEMLFGDGAAAVLIGKKDVVAEIDGFHSIHNEMHDVWRTDRDLFVRSGEERFIISEGYNRVIQEAVSTAFEKFSLKPNDFSLACFNTPNPRMLAGTAKKLGFDPKNQVRDTLHVEVGNTGSAMPLMLLVDAIEKCPLKRYHPSRLAFHP